MHVVITGGLGFIGSRIARRLLDLGHRVTLLDDMSTSVTDLVEGADIVKVDIRDENAVAALRLADSTCLMHLGGASSGPASAKDPVGTVADGYRITYNALNLAVRLEAKRFLHASSMVVYGDVAADQNPVREDRPCLPKSPYAIMKFANERQVEAFCQEHGIGFNNLRLFNVYGPGQDLSRMDQGLVSIFLSLLLKSPNIVSKGALERFRDIVHIDDVAEAWILAATRCAADGPLNIASGHSISVGAIIDALASELGRAGELNVEVADGSPGDLFGISADISALRAATEFEPRYPPEKGVRQFARWAVTQRTAAR